MNAAINSHTDNAQPWARTYRADGDVPRLQLYLDHNHEVVVFLDEQETARLHALLGDALAAFASDEQRTMTAAQVSA